MPAEKKKGILTRMVEGAQAKVEEAIRARLDEGEELLDWTGGRTSPSEIFSVIPILATWHKLKTKHWITALTNRRVLLLRHQALSTTSIVEAVSLPLNKIRGMQMHKGILFVALQIDGPGGPWLFRDMEKDRVEPFIAKFKATRKASAGG